MKFRSYIVVFLAVFTACFFMAGCLNENNKIPPNCYDEILNYGEEKIDCGGPNCDECDHCENGIWDRDRGELWRDCGGECPVCPQCANGKKDGDEIGIDCGGQCGGCELLCRDGLLNGLEIEIDCDTIDGGCAACPTCNDGILNGDEAGIDCGGVESGCIPCCSTGNCRNGIQDGMEFYIDCGGNSCPECDTLFSFVLESANYSTPRPEFSVPSYDDGTGVLEFLLEPAYDPESETPDIPSGTLTLRVTRPPGLMTWNEAIGDALQDPTLHEIRWTDASGVQYSSSIPGGECLIVISKYNDFTITQANTESGCNKPEGDYRFFRGSFEGTLVTADPFALPSEVELSLGRFQFTFLP
jgi:hypothetical protein